MTCLPDERELYVFALTQAGFDTVVSSEIAPAVELATRKGPGVVITDMTLDSGTGIDLARHLRCDERTKQCFIIVVSARVAPADRKLAELAGCDVFLPKPCLPERLVDEVRKGLSRTRPSLVDDRVRLGQTVRDGAAARPD